MSLRTTAKFVTPDDFKNLFGIDLRQRLRPSDNESNKADLFLMIVEDKFLQEVDRRIFRNYDWDEITLHPDDLEAMQKAVLTQALYVYRNSDLGLDSGYDPDRGVIVDKEALEAIKICDDALNYLRNAGLYVLTISNRRRYQRFN